jgi:hypothetical protein
MDAFVLHVASILAPEKANDRPGIPILRRPFGTGGICQRDGTVPIRATTMTK